jgi:hypothetical protein
VKPLKTCVDHTTAKSSTPEPLTRPSCLSPCGRFVVPLSQHNSESEKPCHSDLTVTPYHPRRSPCRTSDNLFGLDNLLNEPNERNTVRLEGIPPEKFTGERGQTIPFLTKFKRYILMNNNAAITQDPYKRAAFFLLLIRGTKLNEWVKQLQCCS